jgi:hypothetical protein
MRPRSPPHTRRWGTLIFLNGATEFAISRLGVAAKTVTAELNPNDYYSPGSLLNVHVDTRSPLAYGVPAELAIWSEYSPGVGHGIAGGGALSGVRGAGVGLAGRQEGDRGPRAHDRCADWQRACGVVRHAVAVSRAEMFFNALTMRRLAPACVTIAEECVADARAPPHTVRQATLAQLVERLIRNLPLPFYAIDFTVG